MCTSYLKKEVWSCNLSYLWCHPNKQIRSALLFKILFMKTNLLFAILQYNVFMITDCRCLIKERDRTPRLWSLINVWPHRCVCECVCMSCFIYITFDFCTLQRTLEKYSQLPYFIAKGLWPCAAETKSFCKTENQEMRFVCLF